MEKLECLFDKDTHIHYLTSTGEVEAIQASASVPVATSVGILVPSYKTEDHSRNRLSPMRLFPGGELKSLAMQERTVIETPLGKLKAEMVTFYKSGAVRRVFPLNGKVNGYWTENDEYKLAESLKIPTSVGEIEVKPLYIHFYESGELKSVTFWPKERVTIKTPIGSMQIRRGLSFYIDGTLSSCEPAQPVKIQTPLGSVEAYDPDPCGMNGENNSLRFSETGKILALDTIGSEIIDESEGKHYTPAKVRSMCSDTAFVLKPMSLHFSDNRLEIFHGKELLDQVSMDHALKAAPYKMDLPEFSLSCG